MAKKKVKESNVYLVEKTVMDTKIYVNGKLVDQRQNKKELATMEVCQIDGQATPKHLWQRKK